MLDAAILETGLARMEPVDSEAQGIDNFVAAWEDYFTQASVAGVPTATGTLQPALGAMRGAMTGIGQAQAAAVLQAAISAFWGVVIPAAATIWVTVPPVISATPPPGLGGVAAVLTAVFEANVQGELGLAECAKNIANGLHPLQLGGIAVQQLPPAPPVNVPIL